MIENQWYTEDSCKGSVELHDGVERVYIQMTDTFLTWINSKECFDVLCICARQVAKRAASNGLALDDAYLEDGNRNDFYTAVATDLWQFIKERVDRIAEEGTILLLSGDSRKFMDFLCGEFLDHLKDQRRTDTPFYAYYRHMRTVLSQADGVCYKAVTRKGSFYAWSTSSDLIFLPDSSSAELHYGEWSACSVCFSDIHEKPAMLQLSRHYWGEALHYFLMEYLLPIRELVKYVAVKYPLITTIEYTSGHNDDSDENDGRNTLEDGFVDPDTAMDDDSWKRQLPTLPYDIIDTQLETLARDCVAELTKDERIILCRIDANIKLDVIARELGMKGPSNVSYHQKNGYTKIRRKWKTWAIPDSEHYCVAEDEQLIFFKKIIEICKEAIECRDSRKEERP
jgi:hypothetical protein